MVVTITGGVLLGLSVTNLNKGGCYREVASVQMYLEKKTFN